MVYLARVQKKGLFGTVELQLLAQQDHSQRWLSLKPPEIIFCPEGTAFNSGVLVLVELSDDRGIRTLEDAVPKVAEWLQMLSQQQDQRRELTERELTEIEQWRQSLTRQSQELRRREAEIEARQEQLQQWELSLRQHQGT